MINKRTFRLFISSPFSDFIEERAMLHKHVFPEIEGYCTKNNLNFQFQAIDLRWGVSEESQLDQKTLEVCLDQVKDCQNYPKPNFLIMSGDRYGWVPLPYAIEEDEFESLEEYIIQNSKHLKIHYTGKEHKSKWGNLYLHIKMNGKYDELFVKDSKTKDHIVEFEFTRTLDPQELLSWYELDSNRIPSSYILKNRIHEYEKYEFWVQEENALRKILQNAVLSSSLPIINQDKYFISATEHEFNQIAKSESMPEKHIYSFTRTITNSDDVDDTTFIVSKTDKEKASTFKNALKISLKENNHEGVTSYNENALDSKYLNTFIDKMTKYLLDAVKEHIEDVATLDNISSTIQEQNTILEKENTFFLPRLKYVGFIKLFIESKEEVIVAYGPEGVGKTALLFNIQKEYSNIIFRISYGKLKISRYKFFKKVNLQ